MNLLNKIIKVFFFNLLFIFLILVGYELIFGNWFNNKNFGNLFLPLNKNLIIKKLPYYSENPILYTTDKNGFRSNNHDLDSIEILIIGGSTTEEKLIDDKKIWTKILEKHINKNILNAGIGGQTSFGHVKIFDLWLSRYKSLKPDIILFYLGINDALYMIENIKSDNLDKLSDGRIMNSIDRDNLIHINQFDKFYQFAKNNSALVQLYKLIKGNIISYKYKMNYNKKLVTNNTRNNNTTGNINNFLNLPFSKNDKEKFILYKKLYVNNLNKLLNKAIELDSKPIFITQIISSQHWLFEFLNEINVQTKLFCIDKKLKCIYLDENISLEEDDFYDGIHTNPSGSYKIGTFLSNYFR